ncbi:MAG TPA: DUF2249 domain-containing protein [Nocardioides sp.]|nr:DUF2249 domain-containing protein [Nocardioides sp.]
MNDVMVASSEADARAGEAVVAHHAELAGALAGYADQLLAAARSGRAGEAERSRTALVAWCRAELVPHALAEEEALYPAAAARPEAALLVTGMLAEHQAILRLVADLDEARDDVSAAASAAALRAVFDGHLAKENELVLPLLLSAPGVSVAALLAGMHDALGGGDAAEPAAGAGHAAHTGHACGCGEVDPDGFPELDARSVPHAIRHATVFGALDAVRPGGGLVLVAPHDPLPLLAQIERREPDTFDVEYLQRGPEAWRLAIVRRPS